MAEHEDDKNGTTAPEEPKKDAPTTNEAADATAPETDEAAADMDRDAKAVLEEATRKIVGDKLAEDLKSGSVDPQAEGFEVFKRFVDSVSRAAKALETEAKRRLEAAAGVVAEAAASAESSAPKVVEAPPADEPTTETATTEEPPAADAPAGDDAEVIDLGEERDKRAEPKRRGGQFEQRIGAVVKDAVRGFLQDRAEPDDAGQKVDLKIDGKFVREQAPAMLATLFGALAEAIAPGALPKGKSVDEIAEGAQKAPTADEAAPETEGDAPADEKPADETPPDESPVAEPEKPAAADPQKVKLNVDFSGLFADILKAGMKKKSDK